MTFRGLGFHGFEWINSGGSVCGSNWTARRMKKSLSAGFFHHPCANESQNQAGHGIGAHRFGQARDERNRFSSDAGFVRGDSCGGPVPWWSQATCATAPHRARAPQRSGNLSRRTLGGHGGRIISQAPAPNTSVFLLHVRGRRPREGSGLARHPG
jgi:hypothetical protein